MMMTMEPTEICPLRDCTRGKTAALTQTHGDCYP